MPISTIPRSEPPSVIRHPADLGRLIRAVRRVTGSDQATAAGLAGVGVRFLGDLERGKATLRFDLVLRVIDRLGLELWVVPRGWRPGGS